MSRHEIQAIIDIHSAACSIISLKFIIASLLKQ